MTVSPRRVTVGDVAIANDRPFVLIAGPCALESRAHALEMATALKELCGTLGIPLIYKTSFDKANRTSVSGARRPSGPPRRTTPGSASWRQPAAAPTR